MTKSMRKLVSAGHKLHIVYEVGPCGFVLQRHFSALGWDCDVVAPSSTPRPAGERIKTDRRDAMKLARLARANDLAVVRVPGPADEAMRDMVRAREDSVREQRNARHRLKALLLRNGIAYAGKTAWTAAHLRWLATVKMEHAAQQIGFQEYLHSITESAARIEQPKRTPRVSTGSLRAKEAARRTRAARCGKAEPSLPRVREPTAEGLKPEREGMCAAAQRWS